MPSDESELSSRINHNDICVVARKALVQLLEPLVGFVLDAGLNPQDLRAILRQAAVRSVATRQLEVMGRVNISGIAASTGIPRAEISKILKSRSGSSQQLDDRRQQSTNKVLAIWHQDPKYTTANGKPADLKIYGRGATFDVLVRNHGRGIPTRAMLDELTQTGAAEVLSSRLIRAKTSAAVERGMTPQAIRSFGDRATELLSTMLQNMRDPEQAKFIASVSGTNIPLAAMPLFRKELASKGSDFLAELHESMVGEAPGRLSKKRQSRAGRVSVTIFYHESLAEPKLRKVTPSKRRNFRRVG